MCIRDRRTIRKAVIYSALAIGAFYVFTTYAATVYRGPGNMADFIKLGNGDPWTYLAKAVWGVGWLLVFIAIINSACLLYTSDAADDLTRVDLGGCRIITK